MALWRASAQVWVDQISPDDQVAVVLRSALPLLAVATSGLLIAFGSARPQRALALDAGSHAVVFAAVFALSLASHSRDAIGLLFVLAVAVRTGPLGVLIARDDRGGLAAFAVAFALYAPLSAWSTVAAAPYGDQVHYLLAADRLAQGSLDATIDPALFRSLIGAEAGPADTATHVIAAPAGPRSVQGPVFPALLVPGWLLAGSLGAHLVVALIAAAVAAQLWLLLREVGGSSTAPAAERSGGTALSMPLRRTAGVTWLACTFLAPALPLATHLYPNVLGALLATAGYRYALTRAVPLPLAAGAILGATLLLTPRDGLLLLALAPFALARHGRRFAYGALAALAVAVALNAVVYGVPLPYAGYLFGTQAAQALEQEPSLSFRFWVGLPAILFDRTFGLAAVAPWAFIALAGLAPALRERRATLLPAAVAIGVTLAALSIFRYWEGGYAPPARYLVEVLPLAAPFLAYGLTVVRHWLAALLLGLGALSTVVLAAIPTTGLNSAFEHKLREQVAVALGIDPLGWLPSFQPVTPDWYVGAYLRLIPAVVAAAVLVWLGRRRARA